MTLTANDLGSGPVGDPNLSTKTATCGDTSHFPTTAGGGRHDTDDEPESRTPVFGDPRYDHYGLSG